MKLRPIHHSKVISENIKKNKNVNVFNLLRLLIKL